MSALHGTRVRAILRKELLTYRRTVSIVWAMVIIPLVFMAQPLVSVFAEPSSVAGALSHRHELLYMLGIPALVPATVAAYAIVGERQEGTLEPVLTTPVTRAELLLGKALSVLVPAVAVAYFVYGVFIAVIAVFAAPGVAPALMRGSDILAQVIFTPLLAGWSVWVAIAISTRVSDTRTAQQLSVLASLPTVAVTTLIAVNAIHPSLRVALAFGIGLLIANRVGWRVVSALFDRERLIAGTR